MSDAAKIVAGLSEGSALRQALKTSNPWPDDAVREGRKLGLLDGMSITLLGMSVRDIVQDPTQ